MRKRPIFFALMHSLVMATLFGSGGCNPQVRIRQSPGPHDTGIRYYRPKPYLLIEPAEVAITDGKSSSATKSDEFVQVRLEYLPDFAEEYSINVRPGFGTANVSVALDDGWNLTTINQELDSQFDENVKAVAELAKAGASFVPTREASPADGPPGSERKWVVRATNVPIGYYESVISKDPCGKKRMFGWRYVGFLPYAACPTEMCGVSQASCHDLESPLMGIVFEEGVMTFKRLDLIGNTGNTDRTDVSTGAFQVTATTDARLDQLRKSIQVAILETTGLRSQVIAATSEDLGEVDIEIAIDGSIDKSREAFIIELLTHPDVENRLRDLGDPVPNFPSITGIQAPDDVDPVGLIDEDSNLPPPAETSML